MRKMPRILHVLSWILMNAGSSAVAQVNPYEDWPQHSEPGVTFWQKRLPPASVEWIRAHHPKYVKTVVNDYAHSETLEAIGSDGISHYKVRKPSKTDTNEIYFSYSGDTVILKCNLRKKTAAYIQKYDKQDTLRYEEDDDTSLGLDHDYHEYDAYGRMVFWSGHPPAINYIDSGRFVESLYGNWLTHTYYGPGHRVDSEIVFASSKYRADASVRNTYDEKNRLIVKGSDEDVDSFFYYPNGVLSRLIRRQTDGLDDNDTFDIHGNKIVSYVEQMPQGLDTIDRHFEYDKLGRPVKLTDYDGHGVQTFEWGDDNRPIGMKCITKDGYIYREERCFYEF